MKEQLEEIGKSQTLRGFVVKGDNVVLDFGTFKLKILPETYEEFKFYIGREYDKEFLKNCLLMNEKNEVIRYVLNKVNKHNYCESDIVKKVDKKFSDFDKSSITNAISDLKRDKCINDTEYVNQYMDYFLSGCYGKYYIINYFNLKKIDSKIISKLVFDDDVEKQKAESYFNLIKNKYVSNNIAKQKKKIYEQLLKRGFDATMALDLINSIVVNPEREEKALVKSYIKAKNKYKDVISDHNIRTDKIISYLVSEGYDYDDIKSVMLKDEKGDIEDD
ncbi:MAG: RecX family transcriptional regulator [Bacilli bacterium]